VNATGPVVISGANSGLFTDTEASGSGGSINVQAARVDMTTSAMSAASSGTGNAGNVTINAADSFINHNSSVTTSTTQSDGGNIMIKAGNLVQLGNSEITTSVQGGAGSGGNVNIDPPTVILDHSKIIASAIGGNGGNINIVAGVFLVSPDSIIDASSQFGVSGIINIESPITNLSGTLAPLSSSFLRATGLVRGCAARLQGGLGSSLTVQTSRDRVPAEPGELLLGPLFAGAGDGSIARGLDGVGALQAHFTFPLMDKCPS
jgi:large exoprotein involved in heme utilization and adhesion